jgi:hypothetical protein
VPDCLTKHIGFRVVAVNPLNDEWHGVIYLNCPKCGLPACGVISTKAQHSGAAASHGTMMQSAGDVLNMGWAIERFWPEPPGPLIPELLPPDVERAYLQAERNFPIAGNEDASGTM